MLLRKRDIRWPAFNLFLQHQHDTNDAYQCFLGAQPGKERALPTQGTSTAILSRK